MKIQHKLVLYFSILTALAITICGILYVYFGQESLSKRVEAQLQSVVVLKENELNRLVENAIDSLKTVAEEIEIQNYFTNKISYSSNDPKDKENVLIFIRWILSHSMFSEIHVISVDGDISISTEQSNEQSGRDWTKEQVFIEGKKNVYIQNFYYDITSQKFVITISEPIINNKGNVVGVAVATIDMDEISKLMSERSGLGKTGETYLINKFNYIVSELKKGNSTSSKTDTYTDNKTLYTEYSKDCLKGSESRTSSIDYAGDRILGYYKWLPQRDVCLVAQINSNEALSPLYSNMIWVIIFAVLLIVFTIIFGSIIAGKISKPIIHLRDVAILLGKGNLDSKINITTKDEIGELAHAFNQMTVDLKKSKIEREEYSKNLETIVKTRTNDLNQKMDELEKMNKLMVGREIKMIELKNEIEQLTKK